MGATPRWRSWIRLQFSLRTLFLAFALLAVGCAYIGSYVSRSIRGRYEPAVIGLNGVKSYAWAPEGFVADFQWNTETWRFYYPLYEFDQRYWHKSQHWPNDDYPFNEVKPEEIGRVYDAWSLDNSKD